MLCPICGLEVFLDHVQRYTEADGSELERFAYVCMNPNCSACGHGFTTDGTQVQAQIRAKGA